MSEWDFRRQESAPRRPVPGRWSEWDFRWQESRNPPRRPVPGRWRRPRPQGLADCFPGNISAVAGGDAGADLLWQGEVRRGDSAAFGELVDDVAAARGAADLAAFGVGEPVVAPRVRRREPDDTFPLPPWPRPTADAAWPWQQISAGTHADSGAGVPAAGAVKVNPLLIGALGSGKSAMHGFVVGGGEDR